MLTVLFWLAAIGAAVLLLLSTRWPRRWLPQSFGVLLVFAFGAIWALGVWAFLIEPEMLVVRRVQVESAAWRGPPLRIGLMSDTHGGSPHGRRSRLDAVMDRMNEERPDIVLLAGDYAGRNEPPTMRAGRAPSEVLNGIAAFRRLRAPLGVYAVPGNHDVWYDEAAATRALRRAGATVLANDAARVSRRSGAFWVAGLPSLDSFDRRPEPRRILADIPNGEPVLMLMHESDSWASVPSGVALSLAGHSHCGQVNLPFVGRPVLPAGATRWSCGLYRQGVDRILYVTAGVGVSKLPIRFNQPPEIVVITLRAPRR